MATKPSNAAPSQKKTAAKNTRNASVADKKSSSVKKRVAPESKGRTYLSQADVPAYDLSEAILVAKALIEQYGGHAATPLDVAAAMELSPSSEKFRMLTGASIAYGLTNGGCNAAQIIPTELAERILSPQEEEQDLEGKREAVLKPRILREFLSKYSGSKLPRDEIAFNVLKSMGVPQERTSSVWQMIQRNASSVGFLQPIKGQNYVNLGGVASTVQPNPAESNNTDLSIAQQVDKLEEPSPEAVAQEIKHPAFQADSRLRRVFITHGKNTSFIEPLKELLGFGELIPVVSVQKESVAQPVPDKVMNDMRSCGAGIIHVDGELRLLDSEAKEHTVINSNVLIEIGAAMALYGRRFILLVKDGVKLPSNLQGLYEVRYQGDSLDGAVTIRLLKAINEMKGVQLPTD